MKANDGFAPADAERRFGGLARLYGVAGAARIQAAHVVVVGLGGVGSWAAEALARSGVGRLTLIDMDHVAESNINRQVQALTDTVGQAKVEAMRARIAQINPTGVVRVIDDFVSPDNWPALLLAPPAEGETAPGAVPADALIDACDQLAASWRWRCGRAGSEACASSALAPPGVSGTATRWPSTTWPAPRTTRCWRSCAIGCGASTARRAMGAAWA